MNDLERDRMTGELRRITEIDAYLDKLQEYKNDILILLTVKDSPGRLMPDQTLKRVRSLGCRNFKNELWYTYIGILYLGEVKADLCGSNPDDPSYIELVVGNGIVIKAKSASWNGENINFAEINGKNYTGDFRGLNIVTYDVRRRRVIDSVGYDAHNERAVFRRAFLADYYKEKYALKNILPQRIKIRIVFWGGAYLWNVFKTIVDEFNREWMYDIKIVQLNKVMSAAEFFDKKGLSHCFYTDYDIRQDSPDIILFATNNSTDIYSDKILTEMRENAKLLIAVPVSLVFNSYDDTDICYNGLVCRLKKKGIDFVITDRLIYETLWRGKKADPFMRDIGNAKFDSIYLKLKEQKELPDTWAEKVENKKVVLWLLDHDFEEGTNVTFDLYAKAVFEFIQQHENVCLIFRPHPFFLTDIKRLGIWSEDQAEEFRKYIEHMPDMIWDEYQDYSLAYQTADLILSDVACGTTVSALSTKKPMAVLLRNDCDVDIKHPEIIDNLYVCRNSGELMSFLENVDERNDPLREQRYAAAEKYISHFDGQNGKRIKEFVMEKYQEKCTGKNAGGGGKT